MEYPPKTIQFTSRTCFFVFPTLKIGGEVPYTPTRPLLLPYTLVGTLPRICHIYIYMVYEGSAPPLPCLPPPSGGPEAPNMQEYAHFTANATPFTRMPLPFTRGS